MNRGIVLATLVAALVIVAAAAAWFVTQREPAGFEEMQTAGAPPGVAQPDRAVMLAQLAMHLEKNPRDSRGWVILARMSFERDDFAKAAEAYARAVALPGKVAGDPMVWCEYADAVAMANGGKLDGQPRELIEKALALDASHPRALEMAGSAEIEKGDYAAALRYWEPLLKLLPPGSPLHGELSAAVERTRQRAGR